MPNTTDGFRGEGAAELQDRQATRPRLRVSLHLKTQWAPTARQVAGERRGGRPLPQRVQRGAAVPAPLPAQGGVPGQQPVEGLPRQGRPDGPPPHPQGGGAPPAQRAALPTSWQRPGPTMTGADLMIAALRRPMVEPGPGRPGRAATPPPWGHGGQLGGVGNRLGLTDRGVLQGACPEQAHPPFSGSPGTRLSISLKPGGESRLSQGKICFFRY